MNKINKGKANKDEGGINQKVTKEALIVELVVQRNQ